MLCTIISNQTNMQLNRQKNRNFSDIIQQACLLCSCVFIQFLNYWVRKKCNANLFLQIYFINLDNRLCVSTFENESWFFFDDRRRWAYRIQTAILLTFVYLFISVFLCLFHVCKHKFTQFYFTLMINSFNIRTDNKLKIRNVSFE